MKRGLFTLASALLFLTVASAQEHNVFEPPYVSVFYYLQGSGEGMELERQTPNVSRKGDKIVFTQPGEKSPVRLSASEEMQFVVRVTEDFDKATTTMQLFRFEVQHGVRQLLVKREDISSKRATLSLKFERYGSSSLKLAPFQKLAPGEYCLSRSTISQGFCFGIDAAGNQ
jgi:hypothetical protein